MFRFDPPPLRLLVRPTLLFFVAALCCPHSGTAHGSLEGGRTLQVRLAGPGGHAPAPWTESYYTWNQNSQNFPNYANNGFSYATTVPDGTLASAGINDGVHSGLNFSGLNNASPDWQQIAVTAGGTASLHFLATAPHDPSHFLVYLTKPGVNADTKVLAWSDLELLGSWAKGDANRPVTIGSRTNPIIGTMMSYDWTVTIPADRSGHVAMLVVWQRDDPAGEAFFSVQDFKVTPAVASAAPQLAVTMAAGGGSLTLSLQGTSGKTYDLQATDALVNPSWTNISSGTADTAGRWTFTDTTVASHPIRFYRAVARP